MLFTSLAKRFAFFVCTIAISIGLPCQSSRRALDSSPRFADISLPSPDYASGSWQYVYEVDGGDLIGADDLLKVADSLVKLRDDVPVLLRAELLELEKMYRQMSAEGGITKHSRAVSDELVVLAGNNFYHECRWDGGWEAGTDSSRTWKYLVLDKWWAYRQCNRKEEPQFYVRDRIDQQYASLQFISMWDQAARVIAFARSAGNAKNDDLIIVDRAAFRNQYPQGVVIVPNVDSLVLKRRRSGAACEFITSFLDRRGGVAREIKTTWVDSLPRLISVKSFFAESPKLYAAYSLRVVKYQKLGVLPDFHDIALTPTEASVCFDMRDAGNGKPFDPRNGMPDAPGVSSTPNRSSASQPSAVTPDDPVVPACPSEKVFTGSVIVDKQSESLSWPYYVALCALIFVFGFVWGKRSAHIVVLCCLLGLAACRTRSDAPTSSGKSFIKCPTTTSVADYEVSIIPDVVTVAANGQPATRDVFIVNPFEFPLQIIQLRASCGCLAIRQTTGESIKPFDSARIIVSIADTKTVRHEKIEATWKCLDMCGSVYARVCVE